MLRTATSPSANKSVRFSDNPPTSNTDEEDAAAAALFNRPYRDDPDGEGYRDRAAAMPDNQAIHAYHQQVLAQQDEQLDALGESIGRQRELSMRIGDELDEHVQMLEDQESLVDRHQGRLDRARRQVGRITRAAGESKQMVTIIVLIIILVFLIAVLK
jgi:syntaxin 8